MTHGCDYLVLGSGSAGLSSALKAAKAGLKVVVVEKASVLGGTSAMSGAGIWAPANHVGRAEGIEDSPGEALAYIHAAMPKDWEAKEGPLWAAFAENAPRAIEFIAQNTPLDFIMAPEPDPFAERTGGRTSGRMLTVKPLSRWRIGRLARKLRRPTLFHIFSYREMVTLDLYHRPISAGLRLLPTLLWRWITDTRGQGSALMTGLIRGCLDAGVVFQTETQALSLLRDESDRVVGARIRHKGVERDILAARGVLLATGGFEWDEEMRNQHFPGPTERLGSPRTNTGDGQKMAVAAGAALDRMDQANIYPCLPTTYEGRPSGLPMTFQAEKHAILVNRHGRRFISENDFNVGEAIDARDPETGEPTQLPVWLIADQRFLLQSLPFRWYARQEKRWVRKAPTLRSLAEEIGVPSDALEATVARFNGFCEAGRDEDFRRGESNWDKYKSHASKVVLYPIEEAPFVAISINRSILGTKGGARTNARGQVLRPDGSTITGLYAAGLAMANPFGTRAIGPGTTLGPNMTWGFICAETVLAQNSDANAGAQDPTL